MDLGGTINSLADNIGNNRGMSRILGNPIYTSLLLTAVIMIIFYFIVWPEQYTSMRMWIVRTFFYVFAAILISMFLYHRHFLRIMDIERKRDQSAALFATPKAAPGEMVPIPVKIAADLTRNIE